MTDEPRGTIVGMYSRLIRVEAKLNQLIDHLIPEKKDNLKSLSEAKELANKGKKPRKRPCTSS